MSLRQLLLLASMLLACDDPKNPPKPIESATAESTSSTDTGGSSSDGTTSLDIDGSSSSEAGGSDTSDGSGSESSGAQLDVDGEQLASIDTTEASSVMCCPVYNGAQVDALCWPDLDSIPNCQSDPDFPTGGAISAWKMTTCSSCNTGNDPNSTWVLNGAWGYECQGFAFVRSQGYVDSDCNDTNNTDAEGGSCEDDNVTNGSCPTSPNAASTNRHDGGRALMCCDVGEPSICTPAGPGETGCSTAYPTLAWADEWQLATAGGVPTEGTASQQWGAAIDCNTAAYNPPGSLTACRRTRYVAIGFVYSAEDGSILEE